MYKHIANSKGGWKYPDGVSEHIQRNPANRDFWPQNTLPKAPGCYLKHQKRSGVPLVDNRTTKRVKIEKCSLFDIFPV